MHAPRTLLPRTTTIGSRLITAVLLSTASLYAQGWVERNPVKSPSPRAHHAMAFDAARERVVLFGGGDPTGASAFDDTWQWDGRSWIESYPPTRPSSRVGHAMAYDTRRQRIVLFGGRTPSGTFLGDTWEWDGTTWIRCTPVASPPPRREHGMTYDGKRQRMVLFGGYDGSHDLGDTWEWDGASWMLATPTRSPGHRSNPALAYDSRRQSTVLFGGWNGASLGDTWEWDGTTWTPRAPATSPPPRDTRGGMVFDSKRGRMVLFGGSSIGGNKLADTWQWDGTSWIQLLSVSSPIKVPSKSALGESAERWMQPGSRLRLRVG